MRDTTSVVVGELVNDVSCQCLSPVWGQVTSDTSAEGIQRKLVYCTRHLPKHRPGHLLCVQALPPSVLPVLRQVQVQASWPVATPLQVRAQVWRPVLWRVKAQVQCQVQVQALTQAVRHCFLVLSLCYNFTTPLQTPLS